MQTRTYTNALNAMVEETRTAHILGPRVIAWSKMQSRWISYCATDGAPSDCVPEILCLGPGKMPFPVSESGVETFTSAMFAALSAKNFSDARREV